MQKEPAFRSPSLTEATAKDDLGRAESVRVSDIAAHGHGRAYLVERGLEQDGYAALKALVADYLEQAELLAAVPMSICTLD